MKGFITTLIVVLVGFSWPVNSQEINIFSSRHYDTDIALYENFEDLTGIKVNLIEGGSDVLISLLKTRGENNQVDLLITVDAGRLWRAEDLFQEVRSEILESRIPPRLRHQQGKWFGFSKRARVIIYNRERIDPSGLDRYTDLADPAYRGQVCMRSSSNIYQLSLMSALIEHYGLEAAERWAEGVVANFPRPPRGNDTAHIRAVASGICGISVVNTYYLGRLLASTDPKNIKDMEKIGVIFPHQDGGDGMKGTHVNISGGGILKNAPNPEGAIAFLEYLSQDEAQRLFAEGNHEYPVVEGVETTAAIQRLGDFVDDSIDLEVLGINQPQAVQVFDRAGWN